MMASMPVFQEIGANILAGAGKPGAQVEGVDFSALMANVQTGAGDASVPGLAAAATPALASGAAPNAPMPVVGMVPVDEQVGGISSQAEAYPGESSGPGLRNAERVALNPGLRPDMLDFNHDEALSSPPSSPIAPAAIGGGKPVSFTLPAKFAQGVSALPQLAQAMMSKGAGGTDAATPINADGDSQEAENLDAPAKAPVAHALPLLQSLGLPDTAQSKPAAATDAAPSARPSAALLQAATLPANAAAPAQLQAQRRSEGFVMPITLPETAAAPAQEQAVARASGHRQAIALEQSAALLAVPAKGENMVATEHHGGAGTQSADEAVAPVVLAVPGLAPASPGSAPPPAPFQIDVEAPAAIAAPVIDTAAMLGEQVIDMGVEGQWIDRMAREIADISAGTGRASFSLNPENLGRLQVEILQGDQGADVRLIAETDAAATALSQGRHQLQQDARLQAVRINDVQIERSSDTAFSGRGQTTGQSTGQEQAGQQGQSHAFHKKPLIEAVSNMANGPETDQTASARMPGRNARYA